VPLFVDCDDADELDTLFARLSQDGSVMMPPDDYGFSQKFGWVSDRFGGSWQLNLPHSTPAQRPCHIYRRITALPAVHIIRLGLVPLDQQALGRASFGAAA